MDDNKNDAGQNESSTFDVGWIAASAVIIAVGAFVRLVALGLRPFHHDEGVNGWFLTNLLRDGHYHYDPANYHGPTLYYISLAFSEVFGLDTRVERVSVAVWGILSIVLVLYLRRQMGRIGALAAAAFVALSPGLVFISRYFIHETFFAFLGLGLVVSVVLFTTRERCGPGALAWLALVLAFCFLPPVLMLGTTAVGDDSTKLWTFRIAVTIIEAGLIFYLVKMLKSWNGGRPIYLLLAAASMALMLATKETAFITFGTMAAALLCIAARYRIANDTVAGRFPTMIAAAATAAAAVMAAVLNSKMPEVAEDFGKRTAGFIGTEGADTFAALFYVAIIAAPALLVLGLYAVDKKKGPATFAPDGMRSGLDVFRDALGDGSSRVFLIIFASALGVYLIVVFFSSYFTHWEGVLDFFRAYAIWTKTGSKDHTQNGFWAYLDWGMRSDGPIYVISALGAAIALILARSRFAIFTALWAFGLFAGYTIIPYKTPWLAVSFILPMCLAAGYAIGTMYSSAKEPIRVIAVLLAIASAAIMSYQLYDLNFVRYDDEDAPMVYAHTQRQFLDMVADIERFADESGNGKEATIDILSVDYWPLVWYLRDHPKAIFHGKFIDHSTADIIVIKKGEQDVQAMRAYGSRYTLYRSYPLRSGVELSVLVRNDIIHKDGEQIYRIGPDR